MDLVQQQLMNCLAAYRLGKPSAEYVNGLNSEDWERLQKLSIIHKLAPVVCETLWTNSAFCGGNTRMIAVWKQQTMVQAARQAMVSQKVLEITEKFQQQGIPCALVKGLLCRELYTRPDLRPSGDEDLVILPEDRERCHGTLKSSGMQYLQELSDDEVSHWEDPVTSLHIELHSCLFSSEKKENVVMQRLYQEQLQHLVTVTVTGGEVRTFNPTHHFVFLVGHALKHFLAGGVGVRTLCDIISFAEHYRQEIDRNAAKELLDSIHGRGFLDQIFAIGEQQLGFDPAAAGWSYSCQPDPEELLLDSLDAGVYGQSSMSRKHSAGLVVQAVEQEKGKTQLWAALFPSRKQMEKKYSILEEHPAMLPICWGQRICKYGAEVLRSGKDNSPMESVALGKKRTEMMIKYGILPDGKKKY